MEDRQGNFIPPFTENQQPKAKQPVALIVAIVVLALLALGLGVASYLQASRASDLQRQVDELGTTGVQSKQAATEFREIPEVGLKYKLTDQTKDLTYAYGTNGSADEAQISFTTTELLRVKNSKGELPCAAMPIGAIIYYKNEQDAMKNKGNSSVVKQVGGGHYVKHVPMEEGCIVDGKAAPGNQEAIDAVKAAFDSLETM